MDMKDFLEKLNGIAAKVGANEAEEGPEIPGMPRVAFKMETVNEDTKALLGRMAEQGKIVGEASAELAKVFTDHALNGKPEGEVVNESLEKLYDALDAIEEGARNFDKLISKFHVATCPNCQHTKQLLTEKLNVLMGKAKEETAAGTASPDEPAFKN